MIVREAKSVHELALSVAFSRILAATIACVANADIVDPFARAVPRGGSAYAGARSHTSVGNSFAQRRDKVVTSLAIAWCSGVQMRVIAARQYAAAVCHASAT
jgi:hypothetical protein